MRVLVLGGCGFIGSHIVDRLCTSGHSVRVFDRQPERYRSPNPNVEYVFASFSDRMSLLSALFSVDVVVHSISTTVPGTGDLDPKADVQDNLIGTLFLLEAMIQADVKRLVYLSSGGTVYGVPDIIPIPESHPLRPINSYGIVKAAVEHYLKLYERNQGFSSIAIRASNPYGSRQGHIGLQGVIATFMQRLRCQQPLEVWGDGNVIRDYVHVGDLAELCVLAASSSVTGAVNAGSGVGTSISEIIETLKAVTNQNFDVKYTPGRLIDVPCSILDVSNARQQFGWSAKLPLRDGLTETWNWWKELQP